MVLVLLAGTGSSWNAASVPLLVLLSVVPTGFDPFWTRLFSLIQNNAGTHSGGPGLVQTLYLMVIGIMASATASQSQLGGSLRLRPRLRAEQLIPGS